MRTIEDESTLRLLDTDESDLRFKHALIDLFEGDGTIYLVSGYFTFQGYRAIRHAITSFLDRSSENRLIVIVSPASDQFSSRIAHDLWKLDTHGQIELYKQPRGLHAKLYLRDGPEPKCIIGSANITQVAFEYNIELNIEFARGDRSHPDIAPLLTWVDDLIARSTPLRRRDIVAPVQIGGSLANWSNKARLLPKRNVALRVVPVLLLLVIFSSVFRVI